MNTNIQILKQETLLGKTFNVYGDFENPLFLAKDVAEWIEHSNPTEMVRSVDDEEKLNSTIFSAGQNREVTMLTEEGVYEVLMQSRKPIAKSFKKGVKGILKSIRKHGAYITPQKIEEALLNPDILIQLATNLKEEQQKRIQAEGQIESQKPKVLFADAVVGSKNSCLIGELAKLITQNGFNIGQNRLFAWMREKGYMGKRGETYNIPLQQYVEQGLFELKKGTRSGNGGVMYTTITPKVTGKGQVYFVDKFLTTKTA